MLNFVLGANTFDVTVRGLTTVANPEYLFIFVNDATNFKEACTSTETITDDYRSEFTITITSNPVALSGEINAYNYGFYHYYIYDRTAAQIAAFDYANVNDLDIRTLTGLVASGKMEYKTTATVNAYYDDLKASIKTYGK